MTDSNKWSSNPLEQRSDGKWIFWNETWSDMSKPYDTYEEAKASLDEYCKWLEKEFNEESKD